MLNIVKNFWSLLSNQHVVITQQVILICFVSVLEQTCVKINDLISDNTYKIDRRVCTKYKKGKISMLNFLKIRYVRNSLSQFEPKFSSANHHKCSLLNNIHCLLKIYIWC